MHGSYCVNAVEELRDRQQNQDASVQQKRRIESPCSASPSHGRDVNPAPSRDISHANRAKE